MKNTTINKVLEPLNSCFVEKIITHYKSDANVIKLTTLNLIKLFMIADLKKADGLREISTNLLFDDKLQTILKLESISSSQLYRRLSSLNVKVLIEIFSYIVELLNHSNKSIKFSDDYDALNIVDASVVTKALKGMEWASYRKNKAGIKLNFGLKFHNEDVMYPNKAKISKAKEHDVNHMLDVTEFSEKIINLYDRGYVDYESFDYITDHGGLFIIRLKENTVTWINQSFENLQGVKFASKGSVGAGKKKTKHEYYYIQKEDDDGKVYHFLTNIPNLEMSETLSFEDVADLYKLRWQVELFFKWIKQHFKVKHFFGTNETAVTNQIMITLIMYALLALFKGTIPAKTTLNKLRVAISTALTSSYNVFEQKVLKLNPY